MICDVWPGSIRELVDYLERNPWVRFAGQPHKPDQKFKGFAGGSLRFSGGWFLPLRPTSGCEVGIEFNVGMFRWECAGAWIEVVYIASGDAQ